MKSRLLKLLGTLVAAGGLGLGALLAQLRWEHGTEIALPAPTGRFPIGRTSDVWEIGRQPGDFGPPQGLQGERMVWIWYPSAPGAASSSTVWRS